MALLWVLLLPHGELAWVDNLVLEWRCCLSLRRSSSCHMFHRKGGTMSLFSRRVAQCHCSPECLQPWGTAPHVQTSCRPPMDVHSPGFSQRPFLASLRGPPTLALLQGLFFSSLRLTGYPFGSPFPEAAPCGVCSMGSLSGYLFWKGIPAGILGEASISLDLGNRRYPKHHAW